MRPPALKIVSILAFCCLSGVASSAEASLFAGTEEADTLSKPKVLSLETHQGFIIIHSRSIRNIKNSYPRGLNLDLSLHDNSARAWNTCHCYPRTGFSFSYFDFDHRRILGRGYILSFYIEPFFRLGERFSFSVKGTSGLGYLTKPYDKETNPNNRSYSVPVNGYLQVKTGLNYRLAPRWILSFSANYNHISNGGIEKPNKGINFPTASIGIDRVIEPHPFPERERVKEEAFQDTPHWEVNAFLGTKERNNGSEKSHLIPGVQGFYNHQIAPLHSLRVGTEWIVNRAIRDKIRERVVKRSLLQHHRGTLLAGHAFLLGKFRFSEQLGIYLFRPFEDEDPVYQRYSLTYQLSERFQIGLGLKAHRHVADFLDFRVGVRF